MASIRQTELIGSLTRTSVTTASLAASRINIGAQQYVTISALTLNTSTTGAGGLDATLVASKVYYVYAVVTNGAVALIGSQASTLPAGFTQARVVGYFYSNASSQIQWANKTPLPIVTALFSGSGTFIPQTTTVNMRVRMVGGGGGGAGGTSSNANVGGAGTNGGATIFGSSFLIANGGGGAGANGGSNSGGSGGAGSIATGATGIAVTGGGGGAASRSTAGGTYNASGIGGSSAFGGAGYAGCVNASGGNAAANSGAGGGGGGGIDSVASNYGAGGGSGAFIDVIVSFPLASSYLFSVGIVGPGGSPGGGSNTGGAGGSGYIEITES